jgi:F-type H+-transporting ATPase subunit b
VRAEEAALEALKSLGINPIYLLSYLVNFVVLVVLLRLLLYRPILNMFETRRAKIEKGLEDARAAELARANAETEKQRILDEARIEAQKIRAEANQQAEQAAAKVRADAQAEAKKIKDDALGSLSSERDKMLSELRGQIAALAIAAANKLIGESLDRKWQEALIADFFAKVPAQVRSSLAGVTGEAEVISAVPLTPEEQARVKLELALSTASFYVDPKLLGGLRVRVGDKVVDGSVAAQLESLHASLI